MKSDEQRINDDNSKPVITVVIPTYNRKSTLCACVDSLLRSQNSPALEILIVDDCSSDDTEQTVRAKYRDNSNVRYIRNLTNLGQAAARNAGAQQAQGKLILFLDDDNIVAPDMLSILASALQADPRLGLAAPLSLQHYDNDSIWTLSSGYNFWTSQPVNEAESIPLAQYSGNLSAVRPTHYSPNAFMVSKQALDAVGGFDPLYRVMYEEADFGYRILRAGFKCAIVPKAVTYHYGAVCSGDTQRLRHLGIESPKRAYLFARNRSIFLKRFAPWYCLPSGLFIFTPLSALYYCAVALRCKAPAIAWSYFCGTVSGILRTFPSETPKASGAVANEK